MNKTEVYPRNKRSKIHLIRFVKVSLQTEEQAGSYSSTNFNEWNEGYIDVTSYELLTNLSP